MKKFLSAFFALTMLVSLSACKKNEGGESSSQAPSEATSSTVETGNLKLGLAVITSAKSSKDAGEEPGLAQIDTNVAAVLVDASGKIVNAMIDSVQTKVNIDNKGKITTDLSKPVETKTELGERYGMKGKSGIGKEWNEQAAAFAEYIKGKTVDEVKGIAVDESGYPTGDLKASVTVNIAGYIAVVEKAVKNAKDSGAKAGDTLGLGVLTELGNSKDYNADNKKGVAQAYSTYAAVAFGSDGRITACALDASQSNVEFDAAGKITTDKANAVFETKVELGERYGMKGNSGIGKEWNEQAETFAEYVTGKTVSEVKEIAVDGDTHPTDSDLKAGVTVSIGGFKTVIEKAFNNKK